MFLVLIKYEDDGETTWEVMDGPFETEGAARASAREMAEDHTNTFAIVEGKGLIRRTVTEVLEEN